MVGDNIITRENIRPCEGKYYATMGWGSTITMFVEYPIRYEGWKQLLGLIMHAK